MHIPEPWFTKGMKPFVFILSLVPFLYWCSEAYHDGLGANPIEYVTHQTGIWGLNFLFITLLVSTLRRRLHWPQLMRLRRMLGLFTFFYGTLHFFTYIWFDRFFDWLDILEDINTRPFIMVGVIAYGILLLLAVTSMHSIMRWMRRYWKPLHRLVYVAMILVVIHYCWIVKAYTLMPLGYCIALLLLFGERFLFVFLRSRARHKIR